jgi:hypothetical protein
MGSRYALGQVPVQLYFTDFSFEIFSCPWGLFEVIIYVVFTSPRLQTWSLLLVICALWMFPVTAFSRKKSHESSPHVHMYPLYICHVAYSFPRSKEADLINGSPTRDWSHVPAPAHEDGGIKNLRRVRKFMGSSSDINITRLLSYRIGHRWNRSDIDTAECWSSDLRQARCWFATVCA